MSLSSISTSMINRNAILLRSIALRNHNIQSFTTRGFHISSITFAKDHKGAKEKGAKEKGNYKGELKGGKHQPQSSSSQSRNQAPRPATSANPSAAYAFPSTNAFSGSSMQSNAATDAKAQDAGNTFASSSPTQWNVSTQPSSSAASTSSNKANTEEDGDMTPTSSSTLENEPTEEEDRSTYQTAFRFGLPSGMAVMLIALVLSPVFIVGAESQPNQSKVDYAAVRQAIASILDKEGYDDGSLGPLFIRLAWHSSGSYSKVDGDGGSNGAAIRFAPEKDWAGNKGLHIAVKELEKIKSKFPQISYGDLYTLAGAVAVEEMGGPKINWRPGRVDFFDGSKSPKQDNRLPDATRGASHLRDVFYRMGFTDQEIVALSGAHSLGRCHRDRSGFEGPWTRAPTTFSNEFFRLLIEEKWTPKKWNGPLQYENSSSGSDLMMLPSDIALIQDPKFAEYVRKYARDEQAFLKDFASAFSKLLELGVKFNDVNISDGQPHLKPTPWYKKLFS